MEVYQQAGSIPPVLARNRPFTERRIVEAFGRILAREGSHRITLNAVVQEAGVGKQLLYRYFGGLEGVARAWSRQVEDFPADSDSPTHQAEQLLRLPVAARLQRLLSGYLQWLRARPLNRRMLAAAPDDSGPVARALTGLRRTRLEVFARRLGGDGAESEAVELGTILLAALEHMVASRGTGAGHPVLDLERDADWNRLGDWLERVAGDVLSGADGGRQRPDAPPPYQLVFERNPMPLLVFDRETLAILAANDAAEALYGYSPAELLSLTIRDIRPPEDVADLVENVRAAKDRFRKDGRLWRHVKKSGEPIDVEITAHGLTFDGRDARLVLINDVTERLRAESALIGSEARYRTLFDHNPSMFFTLDEEGVVRDCNSFALTQLGYAKDELLGRRALDLYPVESRSLVQEHFNDCLKEPGIVRRWETWKWHAGSRRVWVRETARALVDGTGRREILCVSEDSTEAHDLSTRLSHQASHDSLTGLINRREFERRIERLLTSAWERDAVHALCYVDLDRFKLVNDTCGHTAGDELLRQLGELLLRRIRGRDTLARLGGDEFAVLMEHCPLEDAEAVAEGLREAVAEHRFAWEDKTFTLGASIGLVPITSSSQSIHAVMSAADNACYIAKDSGRNLIYVASEDDQATAKRRGEREWVSKMSQAFQEDRYVLYRQPIVATSEDVGAAVRSFEVLVRMIDDDGSEVPPGAFLPAAERYGISPRLDRWVVERTLRHLTEFREAYRDVRHCAVNLSGLTLSDHTFFPFVNQLLDELDVRPEMICFEITETAAVTNLADAVRFIRALKARGCRFALDDFGSGLSSFGYLKTLPVDFVKIDGMFVKDIADDPIDHAMVRSINEIAHVMGKQTIAEFVETAPVLEQLRILGVDGAQGHGIGPPVPFIDLQGRGAHGHRERQQNG
jgi:diguanylate cyclase (GGDEF)-like protein/PAS domain S-box-containing protein